MRFLRKAAFGVFGVAALVAGAASAATIDLPLGSIGFTLADGGGNVLWNGAYMGQDDPNNPDPNVLNIYDGSGGTSGVTLTWDGVSFDLDPGVSGNWAITNNTAAPMILSLIVDVPVLPVAPSSLMFGSSTISIADANFDGTATLATVGGSALYNGRIDFAAVTPTNDRGDRLVRRVPGHGPRARRGRLHRDPACLLAQPGRPRDVQQHVPPDRA
jgi:hypothetical protein